MVDWIILTIVSIVPKLRSKKEDTRSLPVFVCWCTCPNTPPFGTPIASLTCQSQCTKLVSSLFKWSIVIVKGVIRVDGTKKNSEV